MGQIPVSRIVIVFLALLTMVYSQTLNNTKDLYKKLFLTDEYNKLIRPLVNQSDCVSIVTSMHLDAIINFDEQDGCLTTSAYLGMFWNDESLSWNPSDFGGVHTIYVPQEDVWRPDVTLSNSLESLKALGYPGLNVMVGSVGNVTWNPLQLLKSRCDVDITYFPFDTQTCALTFLAWSYDTTLVRLMVPENDVVDIQNSFVPNAQWTLVSSSVSEDFQDASVTFSIKLQRKSAFYVLNIIIPVVMLSILSIFVFVLPVKSGERASFAVTVFLSMAVFLTIVASELPKNSDVTPWLGLYLIVMSGMNTGIALITVVEIRIAGRDDAANVPEIGHGYRMVYKIASALSRSRRYSRSNRKVSTVSKTSPNATPRMDARNRPLSNRVHDISSVDTSKVNLRSDEPCENTNAASAIEENDDVTMRWNDVVDALDVLFFNITTAITLIATTAFIIIVIFNPQKVDNIYKDLEEDPYTAPWDYDYY